MQYADRSLVPDDAARRSELTRARADARPDLAAVRVLVVDDEPDSTELAAVCLRSYGASVATAFSGAEALVSLAESTPDVLVCDIAMPTMSGYALVELLRAREAGSDRHMPVAALTGFSTEPYLTDALKRGFDLYILKPIEPITFATVVAMLAGRCV
jgi:CheY-like chemotaxis protein